MLWAWGLCLSTTYLPSLSAIVKHTLFVWVIYNVYYDTNSQSFAIICRELKSGLDWQSVMAMREQSLAVWFNSVVWVCLWINDEHANTVSHFAQAREKWSGTLDALFLNAGASIILSFFHAVSWLCLWMCAWMPSHMLACLLAFFASFMPLFSLPIMLMQPLLDLPMIECAASVCLSANNRALQLLPVIDAISWAHLLRMTGVYGAKF